MVNVYRVVKANQKLLRGINSIELVKAALDERAQVNCKYQVMVIRMLFHLNQKRSQITGLWGALTVVWRFAASYRG